MAELNPELPIGTADDKTLPEWCQWKGGGPAPASWYATNPETGERTKVYRSYADYCDD